MHTTAYWCRSIYLCPLMYINVYPMYTNVHHCIPVYMRIYTYVYPRTALLTAVYIHTCMHAHTHMTHAVYTLLPSIHGSINISIAVNLAISHIYSVLCPCFSSVHWLTLLYGKISEIFGACAQTHVQYVPGLPPFRVWRPGTEAKCTPTLPPKWYPLHRRRYRRNVVQLYRQSGTHFTVDGTVEV